MVEIDERVVLRKSGWLSHEKYNETKKHNNENLDNKTIETAKVKKQKLKPGTVKQVKHERYKKEWKTKPKQKSKAKHKTQNDNGIEIVKQKKTKKV